jgi:hypothetical protein
MQWLTQVPIEWGIFVGVVYLGVQTKRCYKATIYTLVRAWFAVHEEDHVHREDLKERILEDLKRL